MASEPSLKPWANQLHKGQDGEHSSSRDALDVGERIKELKRLEVGWLDGKGTPPNHAGLDWFAASFDQQYPNELPLPYLYPTPEGRVRAEWSIRPCELSLEVDLQRHTGSWHALDLTDDGEQTRTLNLDHGSADWQWLGAEVRRRVETRT